MDPYPFTPVNSLKSFHGELKTLVFEQPEIKLKPKTTFSNGYLGSRNDEERSEMRYVM